MLVRERLTVGDAQPMCADGLHAAAHAGSEQDAERGVARAGAAASAWGAMPLRARLAALRTVAAPLAARAAELVDRLSRETGRPPWECQREVRHLLAQLDELVCGGGSQREPRRHHELHANHASRPLGTVAVIGPAMLPLASSHARIVAALIAGNPVVWKPSPLVAASAQLYADALAAARLPAGVFNVVHGGDALGRALVEHPRVDAVVFTGRRENALDVIARARPLDKHVVVHASAHNAAVVLADADLELAAYEIVTSAFLSAGQRCTAIARALVERRCLDALADAVVRLASRLAVGRPAAQTFMGPMLTRERLERFLAARAAIRERGADVLLDGAPVDGAGWCVRPSVHLVERAEPGDELFGPDLSLVPVEDLEAAVHGVNLAGGTGCASLFSRSELAWHRFTQTSRAATLLWNSGTTALAAPVRSTVDEELATMRRAVTLQPRFALAPEQLPGAAWLRVASVGTR
jgi:acyl-CoA reductase-like NAD-dependent aldehyde dehydrogenase